MATDGRTMTRAVVALIALLAAAAVLVVAYQRYTERYTVQTEGADEAAVSRVVRSTLSKASELKVSTLKGTVQSVATDSRGFGWINSSRVMKAPFEVDYFVDVSQLSPADFQWDKVARTLTVRAPDVRLGKVNVDESQTYLDRTTGIFVTRDAMAQLQRQASGRATRVAGEEARKPDKMALARRNARAALSSLFAGPMVAAGIDGVTVAIVFPGDPRASSERWDTSRSLQEVLDNAT